MRTNKTSRTLLATLAGFALAMPAALWAQPQGGLEDDTAYGFYRTIEGEVRLTTLDGGEPLEVEPNYPVLVGDRIWVTYGARTEMVLADGSIVRADGGTDLYFDNLARSADGDAGRPTALELIDGEIQVIVSDYGEGVEPIEIGTENATVYLQEPGVYRVLVESGPLTSVLVREGFAEVVGKGVANAGGSYGSVVVRAGEETIIEGGDSPRVAVYAASSHDSLEIWGRELDGYAVARESSRYVEPSLRYAAAPLDRHGSWIEVEGAYAWRPRVHYGWRPYTVGNWIYTPSGLTWVSGEPWGWVTGHYGSWNYSPGWGWLWYPGRTYSPAWVYWYWGPTHVGWVPVGYYSHYYGPRYAGFGFSFQFGVHGWAGGSWGHFERWTFCPTRYFGHRSYRDVWRSGQELRHTGRLKAVPRGVITTDTRSLTPSRWGKPTEAIEALRVKSATSRDGGLSGRGELPDVTNFVARRPDLDDNTRKAVLMKVAADGRSTGRLDTGRGRSAAPFRPAPPLSKTELRALPREPESRRDAFADRGLSAAASPYREKPGAAGRSPIERIGAGQPSSRFEASSPSYRREVGDEGRIGERKVVATERSPSGRLLPPSARDRLTATGRDSGSRAVSPGRELVRGSAPDLRSSGKVPPVQRVLEGVRSRGALPPSARPVDGRDAGKASEDDGGRAPYSPVSYLRPSPEPRAGVDDPRRRDLREPVERPSSRDLRESTADRLRSRSSASSPSSSRVSSSSERRSSSAKSPSSSRSSRGRSGSVSSSRGSSSRSSVKSSGARSSGRSSAKSSGKRSSRGKPPA